ncbi:LOW QUALITY PROTEIN: peroxisomal multifunctional enzyme type 2-like, partial [Pollicipes pollicipes]|uniref:LOW QUALITY PROTEIN: peroxisomal multifunctional enzyme type 2-like n=1 Tax=Pollicipes pollicipes TaxID=41117 RepID=UPI001884DCBB
MPDQLRFDGQVAVVTGAGGGLGREYALLLGERGAAVVVNDLGSSRDGQGQSSKTADSVVQEIRDKGGKAAANYDSVEEGHKIIETAINEFGRIDILINNAGFLRDRSFMKMEDIDWDLIHRVHLRGAFITTRAAWPHFRRQKYGRIVLTSSAAGLFGNFGQANYSAAKMGLVGLGQTLAVEGQKHNIVTNVLVPAAASRLTESVFPTEFQRLLRPALVAPVVALLCHADCPASGAVAPAGVDVARALRTRLPPARYQYQPRDAILYALSIGVSLSEPHGLRYLYEAHDSYAVHPMFPALFVNAVDFTRLASLPGFPMDLSQLLHGEQYMELKKPLPSSAILDVDFKISDIIDKGDKGALVLLDVRASDEVGDEVAYVQVTIFLRGAGGFGGHARSEHTTACAIVPDRAPDATLPYSTCTDQAALYRLCGDRNPLHIDPDFAALGGQERPILHGLCGLGVSVHAILARYASDQPEALVKVKARFGPVLPGQTLLVDTWREPGADRIVFQTRVKETGRVALSGGYVELRATEPAAGAAGA